MTVYNLGHVVGAKGDKGDKGDKGEKGDKGDKGDTGTITIDSALSTTSSNAVKNSAIAIAINGKANTTHNHTVSDITDFPEIPDTSTFIQKSSTTGLVKNDGTIDTTSYLSSLPSHNHSISDVTNLQTSLDAKINTSDIANNLTTTTSGKVLDARQGKILADLIGDAIDYINL